MTEAEWLACDDLSLILYDVCAVRIPGRLNERVLRLFTAACARRVWGYLVSEASRAAVELSEHAADYPVPEQDLRIATAKADDAVYELNKLPEDDPRIWAAYAASYGSGPNLSISGVLKAVFDSAFYDEWQKDIIFLLRECTGSPFQNRGFEPGWRTVKVLALTEAAYSERSLPSGHLDTDRLTVLSDALEDAGCTDADILAHLRSPGPHVRGCWALDLVLGKV